MKGKRATTLGRGDRDLFSTKSTPWFLFIIIGNSPSPDAYSLPSDFTPSTKKGFQFGISREAYAKVYTEAATPISTISPGPGAYNVLKDPGSLSPKYSMRLKTANPEANTTIKIVPGPGQYALPNVINGKGNVIYSKFRSSAATLFNPPCSVRMKESRKLPSFHIHR